jgi:hypothetical protein
LLAGAVDEETLAEAYDKADLFVMPSLFEGYGMVLTEALARALPILCTTGGAAAETAPDAAAFKVPPGDIAAFTEVLGKLIDDRALREGMANAAWAAADDAAALARHRDDRRSNLPEGDVMGGFSPEWLALREPADHAARNPQLLAAVGAHFTTQGLDDDRRSRLRRRLQSARRLLRLARASALDAGRFRPASARRRA